MVDPFDASAAFVAETIGLLREHKPGLASAVRSLCSDIESGSSRPVLAAYVAQGLHADLSGCLDRLRLLPSAAGSADEQQLSAALAAVALLGAAAFSRGGRLEDGSALLDAALLRSRAKTHSAALQRVLSLVSLTLTTGPHPGTSSPPATEPPPSTRGWGVPPPPTGEMSGADLRAFVSAVCALSCPRLAPRLAAAWPAVRRWSEPNYLRARHGHRLVPVEVGAEHLGERALHGVGEQQVVCTLEAFIDDVILAGHAATRRGGLPTAVSPTVPVTSSCTRGYLAQHTLFEQIPSLRDDLGTPPAVPPSADLRAWFGPAGVATPVHHDLHHGLLVQLVGRKQVQLWPPTARGLLRAPPLGSPLANTSPFDPGLLESPPADGTWTTEEVEQLRQAASLHTLEPGDALLIPQGWWHSAQALTVSFSVSFWWNDEADAGSARGARGWPVGRDDEVRRGYSSGEGTHVHVM